VWFAFGPPVEMGELGRWADAVLPLGRTVLIGGLLLAGVAVRLAFSSVT
jgi:hypothetical protein